MVRAIKEVSYFKAGIVIALFLSLFLFISSLLSPISDLRLVYYSIYYSCLNFIFFLSLIFFVDFVSSIGERKKKIIFIFLSVTYLLVFLWSGFVFIFTHQSIKVQLIFFVYKINPLSFFIIYIILLIIFVFLICNFLNKHLSFIHSTKKQLNLAKVLIIVFILLLITTIYFFPSSETIFNPIVREYSEGQVNYFLAKSEEGEQIISKKTNLAKPNVIFILMESVSYDKMPYAGYSNNLTPNIEELSKKSIVFEEAYSTATHSDYAQPAYLSSRYMIVNNYRNFFNPNFNRTFVWDLFKEYNYSTVYFSSQNDLWAGMNNFFNFSNLDIYSHSITDNETDYGSGLQKKDYDSKTIDKFVDWINSSNNTAPFFAYINLQATHVPFAFEEEYLFEGINYSDNKIKKYDNALYYVDLQIGRILKILNEKGIENNTIIIFSSDHGHDLYGLHNIGGHGLTVYNEEIRVPLIFYVPDFEPRFIKERVSHIDVVPTVLSLMNISFQDNSFIGKNMQKNSRFFFYSQNHKYLIGMVKGDLKIIIDLNRNLVEVYNLDEDPFELDNLVNSGNYNNEIYELLMWHYCQLYYFSDDSLENLKDYCEVFGN